MLVACTEKGCTDHKDSDFDGVCDTCGEAYVPPCGGHCDENADFSCDKCSEPYAPICTEHKDTNTNLICDNCGAPITATYSITLVTKDDEGACMSGLVLELENEYDEIFTVTSNEKGIATATLEAGQYRVTYKEESIPEGYICIPKTVFLNSDDMIVELEIINNIPNGTEKRPYVITDEVNTLTVPAEGNYYYIISHAADRTLVVSGEGFKIEYNGEIYVPANSEIRIKLAETEPNEPSIFSVINELDTELNAPIILESAVGSQNNPIMIDSLGILISANVTADGSVYYKWIASFTGSVVIQSNTENKNIKITNNANSVQAELSEDNTQVQIDVTEGDEISIVVSASYDGTVEFTLASYNSAE